MKYFAKYLPVEGEIKEGDAAVYLGSPGSSPVILSQFADFDYYNKKGFYKKVKLFLCSRDIQVGDKVWDIAFNKFVDVEKPTHTKGLFFINDCILIDENNLEYMYERYLKVIGEVSPAAIWIKEGMEFDEDQIHECFVHGNGDPMIRQIQLKGPCGHFH